LKLKLKSEPLKNIKLYLVAGLKYGYDIGVLILKTEKKLQINLNKAPHDFAVNYGVGVEIHFPLFILITRI
jgi:hypothetical protein